MTDLATRLVEVCKQRALSQLQVAEIARVQFTNVGKYERAEAVPQADVFNPIVKALEVSLDYLLNGTIKAKPKTIFKATNSYYNSRKLKN